MTLTPYQQEMIQVAAVSVAALESDIWESGADGTHTQAVLRIWLAVLAEEVGEVAAELQE